MPTDDGTPMAALALQPVAERAESTIRERTMMRTVFFITELIFCQNGILFNCRLGHQAE